ncbi:MAG: glycosyltransferase [Candidatus Micrarchaeota archaeon]
MNKVKKPIVSIIIPAYNEENTLLHCIKAVRQSIAFSKLPCEVIVVDNNSEDNTVKIAVKLADKVYHEKRQVIAAVRNNGACHSYGKFLIFVDADTAVPLPLVRDFVRALSTGSVVVGCQVMPHPLKIHEKALFKLFNSFLQVSVISGAAFSGNAVGYRRDTFNKLGGFDVGRTASEDHDLSNRASRLGKAIFLKNLTVLTSNRRVRKLGLVKLFFGWTKTTLFYLIGVKRKKYRLVRKGASKVVSNE